MWWHLPGLIPRPLLPTCRRLTMVATVEKSRYHVCAHSSQSDHSKLHQITPFLNRVVLLAEGGVLLFFNRRCRRSASVAALSGMSGSAGSLRCRAPFGLAFRAGLHQRTPHSCGIAIDVINGCTRLLTPRVVDPSIVDRVEPEFVNQSHHDLFGTLIIAATGKAIRPGVPSRAHISAGRW